jgi:hypothetical protein
MNDTLKYRTELQKRPWLAANVDVKNKLSIAKIGLNYKFGGSVVARY